MRYYISDLHFYHANMNKQMDQRGFGSFQNMTCQQKRMVYRANEERAIPCNMINYFCMFSDYTPLSLDEWIEVDTRRRMALSNISVGAGLDNNNKGGGEELYAEDFGK